MNNVKRVVVQLSWTWMGSRAIADTAYIHQ
jgi:hypothetical protein